MDLDSLQFKASVRSGWQALDLGFLMARKWWRPLIMGSAIPPLLLLMPLLIIFWENPLWAGFVVWWLKPFWERLPLFFASRKIFAEQAFEVEVMPNIRKIFLKDWIPWLLWRRLSFYRAFDAPVTLLEELKGKARRKRLGSLHGKHTDIALTNQVVCFCCEVIVALGLFLSLTFFLPDNFETQLFDTYDEVTLFGEWIMTICAYFAMVLVMPFHSLAGFALYLNRRIELEAWDIEITFRSLAERKREKSTSLLASLMFGCLILVTGNLLPINSFAATSHDIESAKQLIDDVLKDKDFGEEKLVEKWRFRNLVEENKDKIPEWLIEFVEWWEQKFSIEDIDDTVNTTAFWLKLLLICCFIFLLVYLLYRFRGPLKGIGRNKNTKYPPEIMFGLDVRAESLPDDVPAQVMQIWEQGNHREALGLLYRAALSHLIRQHSLAFKSSHTESECATLVESLGEFELSQYFNRLTRVWRRLAYGHRLPETEVLRGLCTNWHRVMINESH